MDKKEEFKAFVKENPRLVKYIKNGEFVLSTGQIEDIEKMF